MVARGSGQGGRVAWLGPGSSAAWLARSVRDAEAAGSNPAFPTRSEGVWLLSGSFHPAFIPRRLSGRVEQIGQQVGGGAVRIGGRLGVDAERGAGVSVAESGLGGLHV